MQGVSLLLLVATLLGCVDATPTVLHWDAPSTREDGEPLLLSEIGGYRLYSSNSLDGNYTLIEDTQNTSYLVDTLLGYVYITSYDVGGDESKPSNIVFIEG